MCPLYLTMIGLVPANSGAHSATSDSRITYARAAIASLRLRNRRHASVQNPLGAWLESVGLDGFTTESPRTQRRKGEPPMDADRRRWGFLQRCFIAQQAQS
ncbi:hypothetical protein Pla175_04950 [Pirellulimonas nuda]|uniref:Uncharacterized protein n=1 Tax=Pirellulimonas nuda TaxID=2528009 RepID=A0A518D6S0_9BACT|nr:hypothetical protein Pla175_04950 [Pirellulimonas nuda]